MSLISGVGEVWSSSMLKFVIYSEPLDFSLVTWNPIPSIMSFSAFTEKVYSSSSLLVTVISSAKAGVVMASTVFPSP